MPKIPEPKPLIASGPKPKEPKKNSKKRRYSMEGKPLYT